MFHVTNPLHLTPFQEVICLPGRVEEGHGIVTVTSPASSRCQGTWLKHGLSALGTQAGFHSNLHNSTTQGEGPLWGRAPWNQPKITRGSRGKPRRRCLATETPGR